MAWPRNATSAWLKPSGSPAAMRICVGDEVDAGQHLGHRVLDLDPAVDLDEVEAPRRVDEELERADVLVAGGDDGPERALGEVGPRRRRRAPASGASSRIFWWRRWTEQSRSPRWTPWP